MIWFVIIIRPYFIPPRYAVECHMGEQRKYQPRRILRRKLLIIFVFSLRNDTIYMVYFVHAQCAVVQTQRERERERERERIT